MIRTTEHFATEAEAHKRGADFVDGWGYGYGASYAVWQARDGIGAGTAEQPLSWACDMSRYSSCD